MVSLVQFLELSGIVVTTIMMISDTGNGNEAFTVTGGQLAK